MARPTTYVPTENAEAIARVTALVTPEEKATILLLAEQQTRTESNYIRLMVQAEMSAAIKDRRLTQKAIDDKAKEIADGIKTRKAKR